MVTTRRSAKDVLLATAKNVNSVVTNKISPHFAKSPSKTKKASTSTVVKQEASQAPLSAPNSPQVKNEINTKEPISPNKVKQEELEMTPRKRQKRSTPSITNTPIKKRQPPFKWNDVYSSIKKYRLDHLAPVDTMGCDILADRSLSPEVVRYQILTSLQLSSQTKDPVTADAIRQLQAHEPGGLTPQSVLDMPEEVLNGYISKVGFHRRKTLYMKQTAKILLEQYSGDIPRSLEDLLALPGIGPKMAHLTLQAAWNDTQGIGVDTHVHRISYRLGWVSAYETPEQTRKELEEWVPRHLWSELNHVLVGFGQSLCRPVGPGCEECPVRDMCPKRGVKSSPSKKKKSVE